MELLRDAAFGHIVRFVTRGKLRQFQYYEEQNPELWRDYVDADKTANIARYGQVEIPEKEFDQTKDEEGFPWGRGASVESDRTRVPGDEEYNELSGTRVDPEKGKNINLVAFLPNDPENPQNWSLKKKVFVTFQICLLTVGVYIGSAIYSAGVLDVMKVFGVSQVAALLGLTLFVAGYGLGPMIWSPLSEIPQIGRNPIYISTLLLFVLLQIPTAMAVNFGMLLAFRFITGFVGSPVLATGGATLADIWSPKKRAYAIGIWGVAAVCSPTLAPAIGGFAAMAKGWTWPIWELMWLSGFAFVLLFFCLPETSANNILYRRAKRLRKLTGNQKLMCEAELMAEEMTPRDIMMVSLVRPFTLNFTEPMVFLLNLYIALIYGLLYIWFESFPIVFTGMYGFNIGLQGVAFVGILVGALIVIPPFFWYLHKYLEPQFDENGDIQPEKRLPPAFFGGFAIPICLFWFGWTSRPDIHWIVPIIGSAWFSIGSFLLFNSVLNYLPDAYPNVSASVLAGNDLFRSAFGAGFPLFANAMYNKLGVGWASSLLGFLSILFIPIPIILYKVGPTLRRNYSKHARKDI
ncbi:multidrug resistance protein [Colletotrichum orchidophilum]|uniref:Multidrug resistance protein n=1 Tax=Colletotrichum orchidophilum TaxID=1209926 RepID=A0A1G4BS60_9PEZI|nr:multidrug resistance protein [Colletotrichum orchidophilum]OHF04259.1 multidrug resistance protein [Colletotrichum orchidophilum]